MIRHHRRIQHHSHGEFSTSRSSTGEVSTSKTRLFSASLPQQQIPSSLSEPQQLPQQQEQQPLKQPEQQSQQQQHSNHRMEEFQSSTSALSSEQQKMRADIDALRKEASARLDALAIKMDQLQATVAGTSSLLTETDAESTIMVLDSTNTFVEDSKADHAMPNVKKTPTADQVDDDFVIPSVPDIDLDLLEGSRWKIAMNIGREHGTWMPTEWGASGERLLFQMEVDFTDRPIFHEEDKNNYKDEFFQGSQGAKLLHIGDAFQVPRGITHDHHQHSFHGRRPLKVKPMGAYKVCPGEGPMGTDIVRFYIDLVEDVSQHDVSCTAGRVYGTCGYFDAKSWSSSSSISDKDRLTKEYHKKATECDEIKFELDTDERFISWDHVDKWRQLHRLEKQMDQIHQALHEAKQRQPDKSQLRFIKDKENKNAPIVALSREGGLCCKVHKGLALEYHILGRMEVAHLPNSTPAATAAVRSVEVNDVDDEENIL